MKIRITLPGAEPVILEPESEWDDDPRVDERSEYRDPDQTHYIISVQHALDITEAWQEANTAEYRGWHSADGNESPILFAVCDPSTYPTVQIEEWPAAYAENWIDLLGFSTASFPFGIESIEVQS